MPNYRLNINRQRKFARRYRLRAESGEYMGIGENTGQHIGESTGSSGPPYIPPADPGGGWYTETDGVVDWVDLKTNAPGIIHQVTNQSTFDSSINNARPGDVIEIANGSYNFAGTEISCSGSDTLPIVITAETIGSVTFNIISGNDDYFRFTGSNIVFGGFVFTSTAYTRDIIEVWYGTDNRITGNTFNDNGPNDVSTPCIEIRYQAHRTRLDHNIINNYAGTFVRVYTFEDDAVTNGISSYFRADHNTFNGSQTNSSGSAIQIGQGNPPGMGYTAGDYQENLDAYATIEHNFFNGPMGDTEAISIKNNYCTVRYNEMADGLGGVEYRVGKYGKVYGNYIHSTRNANDAISISGSFSQFYNNIINVPDFKHGILMARWGYNVNRISDSPPTHDNTIAYNTILGARDYCLRIGHVDGPNHLYNCIIANNIIQSSTGYLLRYEKDTYTAPPDYPFDGIDNDVTINNNLFHAQGTASEYYPSDDSTANSTNAIWGDPNLSGYELTSTSTLAIDSAAIILGQSYTEDYNRDPRLGGTLNDIGAIEYSGETEVLYFDNGDVNWNNNAFNNPTWSVSPPIYRQGQDGLFFEKLVIRDAPGWAMQFDQCSNITIENLLIERSHTSLYENLGGGIYFNDCSGNITVRNVKMLDLNMTHTYGGHAVFLYNCNANDVLIQGNWFERIAGGVFIHAGSFNNFEMSYNWIRNYHRETPSEMPQEYRDRFPWGGWPGGNLLQVIYHYTGGPFLVTRNGGWIDMDQYPNYFTEDHINTWRSTGSSTNPMRFTFNTIYGGGSTTSGLGIILGDTAGYCPQFWADASGCTVNTGNEIDIRHEYAEDNILVDCGWVGIGIVGGHDHKILRNKIFHSSQSPRIADQATAQGIGVGRIASEPGSTYGCEIANNEVWWYNSEHESIREWAGSCPEWNWWDSDGPSHVSVQGGSTHQLPIGWSSNTWRKMWDDSYYESTKTEWDDRDGSTTAYDELLPLMQTEWVYKSPV